MAGAARVAHQKAQQTQQNSRWHDRIECGSRSWQLARFVRLNEPQRACHWNRQIEVRQVPPAALGRIQIGQDRRCGSICCSPTPTSTVCNSMPMPLLCEAPDARLQKITATPISSHRDTRSANQPKTGAVHMYDNRNAVVSSPNLGILVGAADDGVSVVLHVYCARFRLVGRSRVAVAADRRGGDFLEPGVRCLGPGDGHRHATGHAVVRRRWRSGLWTRTPTILADLYPTERRGRILSYFYLAIPVGSALGFILGGQIAQAAGWRAAFYAVVPPGILLGLLCFLMRDPAAPANGRRPTARSVHYRATMERCCGRRRTSGIRPA